MQLQQLKLQPIRLCEFGWSTCTAVRMTGMGASLRGGAFRADANAKLALQSSDEPWGLPDVSALSVNATARLKAVLLMMLSSLLRSCRHNNTAQPGAGMGMAQGAGRDHFKSPGNSNCVCVFVIFRIGMRCSVSSAYLRSARLPGPDPGSGSSDRVETQTLHVTGAARVFFLFLPRARMTAGRESSLLVYAKVLALMLV